MSKATVDKTKAAQAKAMNVFSDDGSFLERFRKLKEEEVEKRMQNDALRRKKEIDYRIKYRGKRKLIMEDDQEADKKFKQENVIDNPYLKEVKQMSERTLRDEGSGVRPLVK